MTVSMCRAFVQVGIGREAQLGLSILVILMRLRMRSLPVIFAGRGLWRVLFLELVRRVKGLCPCFSQIEIWIHSSNNVYRMNKD